MDTGSQVTIELTAGHALVLFDWPARTSNADEPAPFVDPAEQRVLWDLGCELEAKIAEVFSDDYRSLVSAARAAIRGDGRA